MNTEQYLDLRNRTVKLMMYMNEQLFQHAEGTTEHREAAREVLECQVMLQEINEIYSGTVEYTEQIKERNQYIDKLLKEINKDEER